jgi:hypothetical protein
MKLTPERGKQRCYILHFVASKCQSGLPILPFPRLQHTNALPLIRCDDAPINAPITFLMIVENGTEFARLPSDKKVS